ncbi:RNA polymerase sigma factor [Rubritalea tangerina]|uniref:RNA polymerase sigma factor n=1 Tax=Rubritalea tangerina TaxID=430798 RepID=A0ABW4ZF36_9BACT
MSESSSFPTTKWSLLLGSGENGLQDESIVTSYLCQAYWKPLYVYLLTSGQSRHNAEDLLQGFFMMAIDTQLFFKPSGESGKFRSFLLVSLKNYVLNQHEHATRLKRGGQFDFVSYEAIDPNWLMGSDGETCDGFYDKAWAKNVLNNTLDQLEKEFAVGGKAELLAYFRSQFSGGAESQQALAEKLGVKRSTLTMQLHRMKKRFRDILTAQIEQTLGEEESVEEEVRYLMKVLEHEG